MEKEIFERELAMCRKLSKKMEENAIGENVKNAEWYRFCISWTEERFVRIAIRLRS